VSCDAAPEAVIDGCAGPRGDDNVTWITPDIRGAYLALHRAGYMHTIEAWSGTELAGGLYGVAIGRMFFGESMFARRTDASKVAFVWLVRQLARWGVPLIDCQTKTSHLQSLGARELSRADFCHSVAQLVEAPAPSLPWRFDADLAKTF
jgi:leucyl/phenylalanyl-tRNA--protein transferase